MKEHSACPAAMPLGGEARLHADVAKEAGGDDAAACK